MVPHCQVRPETILEMEVDLRAVERAVAFIDDVVYAQIVQRALKAVGCHFPIFVGADVSLRDEWTAPHVYLKPKTVVNLVDQTVQRP